MVSWAGSSLVAGATGDGFVLGSSTTRSQLGDSGTYPSTVGGGCASDLASSGAEEAGPDIDPLFDLPRFKTELDLENLAPNVRDTQSMRRQRRMLSKAGLWIRRHRATSAWLWRWAALGDSRLDLDGLKIPTPMATSRIRSWRWKCASMELAKTSGSQADSSAGSGRREISGVGNDTWTTITCYNVKIVVVGW